jgi:hypothetical protein
MKFNQVENYHKARYLTKVNKLKNKYKNFLIYGHNSIQFDMKLIFEVAIDYYEVVPIMINKIVLGYKIQRDDIEIIFKDSFLMLPQSLKNLGLALKIFRSNYYEANTIVSLP